MSDNSERNAIAAHSPVVWDCTLFFTQSHTSPLPLALHIAFTPFPRDRGHNRGHAFARTHAARTQLVSIGLFSSLFFWYCPGVVVVCRLRSATGSSTAVPWCLCLLHASVSKLAKFHKNSDRGIRIAGPGRFGGPLLAVNFGTIFVVVVRCYTLTERLISVSRGIVWP